MRRCAICGKTEEEHHIPVWVEYPDKCVCDPASYWGDTPQPICDKYVGDGKCYCIKCQHDKACHE